MKHFLKMLLLLIPLVYSVNSFACHSDLGYATKGHHKWSKDSGYITKLTEFTTVSTANTTSCESYTQFMESEQDLIAEQAAQGRGPHLIALASLMGCAAESHSEFIHVLHDQYKVIFMDSMKGGFHHRLSAMVSSNEILSQSCRLTGG